MRTWLSTTACGDGTSSVEPQASLAKDALSGVAWNYSGTAVLVVVQIASAAATARLIVPAEFGAYAAAQAAMALASYFTLWTIGLGILRRSELAEKTAGTAFALSAATASLVVVAMWLIAVPWAAAWGIDSAALLVRVLAFALFFTSLSSIPLALVRRRLRFASAAVAETSSQIGGIIVSISLAVALHSALALAIGQVVAGAALLVWAIALARRDLRLGFDLAEARELFTYGGQLSVLYFGFYAANWLPSWVAGRSYGAVTLGLYSRANLIVGLPLTYLTSGISKVLFPLYGRVRDDRARTRNLLSEALVLATGFSWPLFAIVAGAAPVVIDALLGPRWHAATPMLRLSALIVCAAIPISLLTNAGEALGWIRITALRLAVFLVLLLSAITVTLGADLAFEWVLAGVAVAQWATYAIMLRTFSTRAVVHGELLVRSHLVHGAVSLVAFALALLGAWALDGTGIAAQIAAEIAITLAVFAIILTGRSWFPATEVLTRRMGGTLRSRHGLMALLRPESPR